MVFCKHCGKELPEQAGAFCTYCGKSIDGIVAPQGAEIKVIRTLPYKNPSTAAIIAIIGGVFGFLGIGHFYVGKIGKGIAILIGGFVLFAFSLLVLFGSFMAVSMSGTGRGYGGLEWLMIFGLGIPYTALWFWQIFNARKLARQFNEHVQTTGKEPW